MYDCLDDELAPAVGDQVQLGVLDLLGQQLVELVSHLLQQLSWFLIWLGGNSLDLGLRVGLKDKFKDKFSTRHDRIRVRLESYFCNHLVQIMLPCFI